MSDLTVLYLTCNKMPGRWVEFHRKFLFKATEGRPMVVISAKEMGEEWKARPATAFLIQNGPFCATNVYRQLLRGASLAETKYVAVAEDDTLYPRRHFDDFRPPEDAVAYDMSRWSLISWMEPHKQYFSCIRKHGNFTMLGPRKLVIDALEEREEKYPNGFLHNGKEYTGEIGRYEVEKVMGLRRNKLVEFWSIEPVINLAHPAGLSPTYIGVPKLERKPGELKAWDIPGWGKSKDIIKLYNDAVKEDLQDVVELG